MSAKPFDFRERAGLFAADVRFLVRRLPRSLQNEEDSRQLIRSSGSIGANYIEADESLGKKDRAMHLKIARKEAKESEHWLQLLDVQGNPELENKRSELVKEAKELTRILSAMIQKMQ